jgi:hypothetical protein
VYAGISQGEEVKCVNITNDVDCSSWTNAEGLSGVWAFDGTKNVWNNETESVWHNACCVSD